MVGRQLHGTTLFPLILAGLLAALTYWLEVTSRPPPSSSGKLRHDPDTIIENFEVRRYDNDGGLQHTLRAHKLTHYPDDDTSVVQEPELTYHREPAIRITARTARLDGEGRHIELIDEVRIVRAAHQDELETVLTTTRLDVYPDEEIASNREPVEIRQGKSWIRGVGMHANHQTALYALDGPVRGIFHRTRTR